MADNYYKNRKQETDYSNLFKTLESEGKLPPQNIELEETLIGTLILDKNVITRVADILLAEDFYRHEHRTIYNTIVESFEKGKPIDIMTVTNRLKEKDQLNEIGGASYLAMLVNKAPAAYNCEEYAHIIHRKRILRDLIAASYEIGRLGLNETDDVDVVLDQAEQMIFQIAKKKIEKNFIEVHTSGLTDAWDRIEQLQKHEGPRGITTGFKQLDHILGGLQKSDMIVLGARPSIGKSALALDIVRQTALSGNKVAFFSLEMSADQLVDRLIAAEANVDLWKIRTGYLSSQGEFNDFTLLHDAFSRLSEAKIYIDDTPGLTALQIRTKARRLMSEHGLDLIVIDYLQLIGVTSNYMNPVQQYTEISKAMKIIARELNIPVLALSQLSRSVEQRIPPVPKLSDLRETGCLTGDSLIMRSDTGELIPIKDLVNQTKKIPIHSLDQNWTLTTRSISKAFSSGKKMTYELKLRSGNSIKASANHPFWKVSGWTRLDELKVDDLIATPRELKVSNPKNEMTKDEIILLAHLLGDGCILPRQPYHYTSADPHNINCAAKIPTYIFTLDNKNIALFLKHLWADNGSIGFKTTSKKHKEPSIYYSTTSQYLVWGIRHLLLRLGIQSRTSEKKKGDNQICYTLSIYGNQNQLKFLKLVGCFGKKGKIVPDLIKHCNKTTSDKDFDLWPKEAWKLMIEPVMDSIGMEWKKFQKLINTKKTKTSLFKIGISNDMLKKIAKALKSPIIDNMIDSDIVWDKVVSIKKLKVEEVYDVTVPELHNFIANDIILENSIEQDADVVMLLYREDRYKKTTENTNVAEVIIAKHRNGATGSMKLYFEDKCASFRNLATTNIANDYANTPDENLDYTAFVPPDEVEASIDITSEPEESDLEFSE